MLQYESVEKSLIIIMFMMMCTSLVSAHSDATANKVEVDHKRIDIWGPGLNIKSQLPSRYLYIQLYSKQGTRYAPLLQDFLGTTYYYCLLLNA